LEACAGEQISLPDVAQSRVSVFAQLILRTLCVATIMFSYGFTSDGDRHAGTTARGGHSCARQKRHARVCSNMTILSAFFALCSLRAFHGADAQIG
jgi:hypothetical protein